MSSTIPEGAGMRNSTNVGECHDCGNPADVQRVGDRVDPSTGYQDQVALCAECESKREELTEYNRLRGYGWGV
jgi:hypothetical protein